MQNCLVTVDYTKIIKEENQLTISLGENLCLLSPL